MHQRPSDLPISILPTDGDTDGPNMESCGQDWLRRKRINIEVDLAELAKLEEGTKRLYF
jgi:hypothetical protein